MILGKIAYVPDKAMIRPICTPLREHWSKPVCLVPQLSPAGRPSKGGCGKEARLGNVRRRRAYFQAESGHSVRPEAYLQLRKHKEPSRTKYGPS